MQHFERQYGLSFDRSKIRNLLFMGIFYLLIIKAEANFRFA